MSTKLCVSFKLRERLYSVIVSWALDVLFTTARNITRKTRALRWETPVSSVTRRSNGGGYGSGGMTIIAVEILPSVYGTSNSTDEQINDLLYADPSFLFAGYAYPRVHGTYRLRWACGNERADPMERFWFCNYNHLMLFAKNNTVFPDFVGEVRGIKTIYNEETQSNQRLMTITRS
ncbi:hypothetical protein F2Q70_00000415 [Brassica cretica]|uniref:Uncharacterized protein n=1 Tax=Brassica cretica TaxID=69181 RepID=A0A8S9J383_BRACR|nr:hypothetical protein F2Q70_00000415 [Brassica cretica]